MSFFVPFDAGAPDSTGDAKAKRWDVPAEEPSFAVHGEPGAAAYGRIRKVQQAQALRQVDQDVRERSLGDLEKGLVRRARLLDQKEALLSERDRVSRGALQRSKYRAHLWQVYAVVGWALFLLKLAKVL